MKATLDLPEELYRRVKARSALEGRPIREVAIELFRVYVESPAAGDSNPVSSVATGASTEARTAPPWVGLARRYLHASGASADWGEIRQSIERGWAGEVAEPPAKPSSKRRARKRR